MSDLKTIISGGDSEEALKIQEEAGATYLTLVENTPLIGHAIAAGHAIAGDAEMAEQVQGYPLG